VETVVFAVSLLEDNELFNAGIGSQIQSDGKIRMRCNNGWGNQKMMVLLISKK
jgi:isoaspartyl peptidase/L-asparaginase-like protein (Ntn-hydrolase superfamily)